MERLRTLAFVLIVVLGILLFPVQSLADDTVPERGVYDASVSEALPADETLDFTFSYTGKGDRYSFVWIYVKISHTDGSAYYTFHKVPGSDEWPADGTACTETVDFREPIGVESQVTWRVFFGATAVNEVGGFDKEATEATGEFVAIPGPLAVNLHANGHGEDYTATVPYGQSIGGPEAAFGQEGIGTLSDIPQMVDGYVRVGWTREPVGGLSDITYDNSFRIATALREDTDLYAVWAEPMNAIEVNVDPLLCGTRVMTMMQPAGNRYAFYTVPPAGAHAPEGAPYRVDGMDAVMIDAGTSNPAPGDMMWYTLDEQGRKNAFSGTVVAGQNYSFDCTVYSYGSTPFAEADGVALTGNFVSGTVDSTLTASEYQVAGTNVTVSTQAHASITVTAVHNWGDWEVVTPATSTTDGLEHRVCAGCGAEETRVLQAGVITEVDLEFTMPKARDKVTVTENPQGRFFKLTQDPAPQISIVDGAHYEFCEAFYTDIHWKAESQDFTFYSDGGDVIAFFEAEDGWVFSSDAEVTVQNATVAHCNPFVDSATGKNMYAVRFSFDIPGPWSVTAGATTGGVVQISDFRPEQYTGPFSFLDGSTITVAAIPDEGYRFVGWYVGLIEDDHTVTGNTGELLSTDEAYTFLLTENTLFQAVFEETPVHTVSFDAGGGSGEMGPIEVEDGAAYVLPACGFTAPKGKVFDRWDAGAAGATIEVTGDVVLTAQWKDDVPLIPIYRMYNTKTSEHLWTKSKKEYDSCGKGSYADWRQENVAWYSPNMKAPSSYAQSTQGDFVYVWRLYDKGRTGDHIYLTYGAEMRQYLANGWVVDKGAGFWTVKKGTVVSERTVIPIYRAYNPKLKRGKHHYTPSKVEYDKICKNNGWKPEGVKFYVIKK